jgi:hypothetical protein
MLARPTQEAPMDALHEVVRLAEAGRVVRLTYRRPGDGAAGEYYVEPYRFHRGSNGPVLHAWQLEPAPAWRSEAWRDFRIDRITAASDGGRSFQPRAQITLAGDLPSPAPATGGPGFKGFGDRPIAGMGDAENYFRQIEEAMLDGRVTPEEMSLAEALRDRVEIHERKAVHARVFASVLHEVLQDGRISHREELYLQNVRAFLDRLGWAP